MIDAGIAAFHEWMMRWDYLADGLPGEEDVRALIVSILEAARKADPPPARQG